MNDRYDGTVQWALQPHFEPYSWYRCYSVVYLSRSVFVDPFHIFRKWSLKEAKRFQEFPQKEREKYKTSSFLLKVLDCSHKCYVHQLKCYPLGGKFYQWQYWILWTLSWNPSLLTTDSLLTQLGTWCNYGVCLAPYASAI